MDWNIHWSKQIVHIPVVPYIGTWIETEKLFTFKSATNCRTLYRYVDWNRQAWQQTMVGTRRTLYRYVDWNLQAAKRELFEESRTLYRYVDWNIRTFKSIFTISTVVPYIGTWIETEINDINEHVNLRRTLYRYVDWNWNYCYGVPHAVVVPYIGTWIETRTQSDFYKVQMSYLI